MNILISVQQVAVILGVSESTVRRMEENKDIAVFGTGVNRFSLINILSIKSQKTNIKTKITIEGLKAKDLKEIIEKFDDNEENIKLIYEEVDAPDSTAAKYLTSSHKGFSSIGIYGEKQGKHWMI